MSETGTLAQKYEAVIGLEIHVQLRTRSKIFCACSTEFGSAPNTQVCPVCLGHPGVLPVLNRGVVEMALRFGLAVGSLVPDRSVFARKNYFYPDLPKGYQVSQYEEPILQGGRVAYRVGDEQREVQLTRAHLEEDAGKSFHPDDGREAVTLVDLNRSGVPLLEIVTEPDLRSPEEAYGCLHALRQLVVYLEICDGNMEEGSLRCDANVSVRPRGQTSLNPKTEVKNLNSFRNVERATAWEIRRQGRALEAGETLVQATRLWDANEGRTRVMRSKEEAHDYRYFPDPDLPPLRIDPVWIQTARAALPELPRVRENRLVAEHGISITDARVLAETRDLADYFEDAAAESGDGKSAANWVLTEVLRRAKDHGDGLAGVRVSAVQLGRMLRMIREGAITGTIGKTVFATMEETGDDPEIIVERSGLRQIQDTDELQTIVTGVVARHAGPVADFRAGKEAAMQFLVGQVMRATRGRANPQTARELLLAAMEDA